MQIMDRAVYKLEIRNRLRLTQKLVGEIVRLMESDYGWDTIHKKTGLAIVQLESVIKLLARYHLEICILKKHKEARLPFNHEEIEEIVKTYRYLN